MGRIPQMLPFPQTQKRCDLTSFEKYHPHPIQKRETMGDPIQRSHPWFLFLRPNLSTSPLFAEILYLSQQFL